MTNGRKVAASEALSSDILFTDEDWIDAVRRLAGIGRLMCGIFVAIGSRGSRQPDEQTEKLLRARGPDSVNHVSLRLPQLAGAKDAGCDVHLTCCSSVLALRGGRVQAQPLKDDATGSLLCWNGEAWKQNGVVVQGNDTVQIFRSLLCAAATASPDVAVAEALTAIAGPYAFVFFDAVTSTLYYGRDRLGRRSLIIQQSDDAEFTICSFASAMSGSPQEVDTSCLHLLKLAGDRLKISSLPWPAVSASTTQASIATHISARPSDLSVDRLLRHLSQSVRLRVTDIPYHGQQSGPLAEARVGVLFSGGLDCTLLARITHDILPHDQQIDLLNVAFENPRSMRAHPGSSPYEICPDRVTGRAAFAELSTVCPQRRWRFVAVDVPYTLSLEHRPKIIELMRPHNSEMDLSIAMALYFAARGQGVADTSAAPGTSSEAYATTARVLLSGLGADELFGGYSRHAAAYTRGGDSALAEELDLDYRRIGQRNLGRDDRVIGHWGRETRYPFLDEDFVAFALELPVWEKCGFRPGRPIPKHFEDSPRATDPSELDAAKMLLRIAAWKLDMRQVASEKKRAIQFGARTAKMEPGGGRRKGTDSLV